MTNYLKSIGKFYETLEHLIIYELIIQLESVGKLEDVQIARKWSQTNLNLKFLQHLSIKIK